MRAIEATLSFGKSDDTFLHIPMPNFDWFTESGDGFLSTSNPLTDLFGVVNSLKALGLYVAAFSVMLGLLLLGLRHLIKSEKATSVLKNIGTGVLGACLIGSIGGGVAWGVNSSRTTNWAVEQTVLETFEETGFDPYEKIEYTEIPLACKYNPELVRCPDNYDFEYTPEPPPVITINQVNNKYVGTPDTTMWDDVAKIDWEKVNQPVQQFNQDGM